MSQQQELPEISRHEALIRPSRLPDFLMAAGGQTALQKVAEELRAAHKQTPNAVGLTLAIAVIERDAAIKQGEVSKEVLFTAGINGLPLDDHRLELRFGENGPYVVSTQELINPFGD